MNNLSLEIYSEEIPEFWDSKVLSSEQGTVFNTSIWSDIIKKTFGLSRRLYCVFKNKKITGGLLLFHKIKFGMKIVTKVPLTSYNGVIFFFDNGQKVQKENQYINETLQFLVEKLEKEFKYCNFSLHPSINDIRTFVWNKWEVNPLYTYIISLGDEAKIRDNFSSSLRRKILKAEDQGLVFKENEDINALISLHEESYLKRNLDTILDKSVFVEFCKNAKEKELLKIFSVYDKDNNVLSSRAVLTWNKNIYDWIAGTSKDFQDNNAGHLLVWKILQKYNNEGYKLFDFMGANTPKIIDFKRLFGGELKNFYDVNWHSSLFIEILTKINNNYKKWKRGF